MISLSMMRCGALAYLLDQAPHLNWIKRPAVRSLPPWGILGVFFPKIFFLLFLRINYPHLTIKNMTLYSHIQEKHPLPNPVISVTISLLSALKISTKEERVMK